MSESAGTPGSSNNNTSPSPPPPASGSSPPPAVSPPPPSDNGDGPPPSPPPPTSTSPPPTLSPPPPSSSPPPPASSSSSSPPPSPLSVAPKASPPPPASTTPPPKSAPNSPPPPPQTPTTGLPVNSTSPPPYKQATPPPPDTATSPPPAPVAASPPSPAIVSPAPNVTGGATPAPSAPISGAPSTTNTPPSPAWSPPAHNGSISPPTPGRSPSGNSSRASPGGAPSNSEVSSNSMGQASNGDGHRSTTVMATGVAVGCAVLFSLIAIFLFISSKKKRKDRAYPPHYLRPKSCNVPTYRFFCGQQRASPGFSGPQNYSYVTQNQNSPLGDSNGSHRNNMYSPDSGVFGGSKAFFTYEQVMEITNGFAQENIIGEGGFGCVYKGSTQDGKIVAVKQLKAGSGQGDREFKAEVEIISRVHHRHLVSLVGYSIADNQRLLIYEFVPNNTLEHHLHSRGLPVLDWQKRLKIAIGSAKGLAYLHEDCHPKIIHRDIKSANILLDDDFEAQVADFGLARLNDTTQTHVSTRVMGTFGYLAPEYASSGKLTDKSDVFSFGVVLLELITGRKPVDPTQPLGDESLVEWARPILLRTLETGDLSELVDPRLQNHYVESEMLRMVETAAACVRHSAPKRPRMMQVVRSLDSDSEMSDLSNGVKYGQSTVYDSGQYNQDIMRFRKMALGGDSSEFDNFSEDYSSRDSPGMPSSSDYANGESEMFLTQRGSGASQQKYGL